jgi:hypothetical protein
MESGLPFVAFPDPDIVEPPSDIKFREEPGSLQSVNEIIDQREHVTSMATLTVNCHAQQ